MLEHLTVDNAAVAGLALIWIIERSLKALKHRGIDLSLMAKRCSRLDDVWNLSTKEEIVGKIDSLYKLHDVRGEDGVPVWYVRSSDQRALHEALHALSENSKTQTLLLQKMLLHMENTSRENERAHSLLLGEVKGE